jgi:hypothetical protein
MATRQSDSPNRTVVYCIMCMHQCYIYSIVLLFWRRFMLYNSEGPDSRHYRTTDCPYLSVHSRVYSNMKGRTKRKKESLGKNYWAPPPPITCNYVNAKVNKSWISEVLQLWTHFNIIVCCFVLWHRLVFENRVMRKTSVSDRNQQDAEQDCTMICIPH